MLNHFLVALYIAIACFEAPAYVITELAADPRLACDLVYADREGVAIPSCVRTVQRTPGKGSVIEWHEVGFSLTWP